MAFGSWTKRKRVTFKRPHESKHQSHDSGTACGRGAKRLPARGPPYLVSIKNNSDGDRMKSRSAFEFTVRKMIRGNAKLYFWTFTFREVHSLETAMGLTNTYTGIESLSKHL